MKVVALTPHFVNEAPPGAESVDAEKLAQELHLKVAQVQPPEQIAGGGVDLDQETREGLKRLSHLIRKKGPTKKPDQRRKRALAVYRRIAGSDQMNEGHGLIVDKSV